jgi:hypothetical protein
MCTPVVCCVYRFAEIDVLLFTRLSCLCSLPLRSHARLQLQYALLPSNRVEHLLTQKGLGVCYVVPARRDKGLNMLIMIMYWGHALICKENIPEMAQ